MFGFSARNTNSQNDNSTNANPQANNNATATNFNGGYVSPYTDLNTSSNQSMPVKEIDMNAQLPGIAADQAALQNNQTVNLAPNPVNPSDTFLSTAPNPFLEPEVTPAPQPVELNTTVEGTPQIAAEPALAVQPQAPIAQPVLETTLNPQQTQVTESPVAQTLPTPEPVQQVAMNIAPEPQQLPDFSQSISTLQESEPTSQVANPETLPKEDNPYIAIPTVEELATSSATNSDGVMTKEEELLVKEVTQSQTDTTSIKSLLDMVIAKNASDLHLTVGYPVTIRVDSKLQRIGEPLTAEQVKNLIYQTLSNSQRELLEVNREVDLSYAHEKKARFRVNAYNERGSLAAAYRLITSKIKSIEELQLPPVLYDFTRLPQGLFLVTGPTGSGKSTTLAAMIQEINENYPKHILTIEDPIEYVYTPAKALVDQRELGQDTHDWNIALRSALRQDPDVVLIGEMRDFETIQAAITTAETGHLVFGTLHTNSAAQSVDRIIDVFPPHQQEQVRTQLASSLKGILSQRLIPITGGGRQAAIELMIVTPAIQNLIREGKTYQIDNIISTSFDLGMTTLERSLVKMIREGKISVETAQEYAIRPEEVLKLMKSGI